jgi:hypothetical protein
MPTSAKRDAVVDVPTAKRGRLSEREWVDVERAARVARSHGLTLKVHGVEFTGILKQNQVKKTTAHKVLQPQVETAVAQPPPTSGSETQPQSLSKRQQRSQLRLQEFQQKKQRRLARNMAVKVGKAQVQQATAQGNFDFHLDIRDLQRRAMLRVKLRSIFWRAWRSYRPIYSGKRLGYLSLKEQRVYRRAAGLYSAAFGLDPSSSSRPLAAWFRRAVPMEVEAEAAASSAGGQPPKRVKKSHGSRAPASAVV